MFRYVKTIMSIAILTFACLSSVGCSISINEKEAASVVSDGISAVDALMSVSSLDIAEDGSFHGRVGMFALDGDASDDEGHSNVVLRNVDTGEEYTSGDCLIADGRAIITFDVFGVGLEITSVRSEDGTWTASTRRAD